MTKKKTKSRVFILLASLLASICLWVYVVGVVNYVTDNEIKNIPITFVGEDEMLSNYDLVISDGADSTVSLTFYGKRSVLAKISRTSIKAQVDLSNIKRTGENIALAYDIVYPDGVSADDVSIIDRDSYYAYITIQKLETKPLEVRGVLDVDSVVAEGYVAEAFEFDPETIDIKGTSDKLAMISHALVTVNRTDISKTITDNFPIQLISYEGDVVEDDGITIVTDTVGVTLPIAKTKDVPLVVTLNEGGGATSAYATTTISPSTITISGDAAIVDGVSKIVLGTIDLSTITSTYTEQFPILIPDESKNLSGIETAEVTVKLSGLGTKTISANQIELINKPEGYNATALTQSVTVVVRAPESLVDSITANNVRLVADLEGLNGVGNYEIAAKVYIDGYTDAGAMGSYDYSVVVRLTAETNDDETAANGAAQANGVVVGGY